MTNSSASPTSSVTLYLVAIQVTSRLLTFAGNQFLLRYVSPSLLGLAVQLELLSVTILYSSRESLRVALQRTPVAASTISKSDLDSKAKSSVANQMQEAVNMSYLVVIVGILNSLLFGYGYLQKSTTEVLQSEDFWLALGFYAAATFIELCAEPYFVVIQQQSLYKARAKAETTAAIVKCLGACVVALGLSRSLGSVSVRPFAVGQFFYALVLFARYQHAVWDIARQSGFSLLLRKPMTVVNSRAKSSHWMGYFSKSLTTWTLTFYAQSIFKLLLTQGDSLILSFVADLSSQGAFALASNYGGLMSRLLFQPVEESSRNTFGRLLSQTDAGTDNKPTTSDTNNRTPTQAKSRQSDIDLALNHLSTTLHLYTLFALPLLAILPRLFPILVSNLVGARWSSEATSQLLSAYAYYLPFLAINGVLDAFVTSAASPKQLRQQGIIMTLVTVIYGVTAWIFMADVNQAGPGARVLHVPALAMGSAGLVWANVVNMTLRIAYSIWFISTWVNARGGPSNDKAAQDQLSSRSLWRNSLPSTVCTITAFAVAVGLNTALSSNGIGLQKRFFGIKGLDAADVGSFAAAALVLVSSMLFFEYQFLTSSIVTILPERLASKISVYLPVPASKKKSA